MKKADSTSQTPTKVQDKPKLTRPTDGRVLAGVGIGLARYLDVDVWLVRLLMLVVSFMSFGTFILAYVFLWLVIPASENSEAQASRSSSATSSTWIGVALILVGGYFLAKSFGLLDWLSSEHLWPALVIIAGVGLLIKSRK